ncbi:TPA: type II toxin-antitoxin system PemK/MazF family toxin [Streptococcus suis]|nr:type II toxin-antitoxin system PemK/MazF family toxin [Streptococcus suis]HEM2764502.1 type II toxin-antitoxin system PemK/MazF family toxin [Streptococcus suis]
MASGRTNDEIALYVAQTITELEEYLHHLTKNGDPDDARADKISQWVESWTKYLKQEKKFNPRSIPAFKRGSIVYVDLGFNVGTEYGGIHYAIVLNKKDSRNNTLLHILPLTSIKETTDVDNLKYYQLSLSNEIHRLLIQKAQNNIKSIAEKKIIFEEKQEK